MSSASVDDLHPGFGPSREHFAPILPRSHSPFGSFVRKRSYPMSQISQQQRAAEMHVADETAPLAGVEMEAANSSLHSSDTHTLVDAPARPYLSQRNLESRPGLLRQLTSTFTTKRTILRADQTNQHVEQASQHAQTMADPRKLTFFERHFTRPVASQDHYDATKEKTSRRRRFSFLAHGTLITAAIIMLLLLGIVLGTALALTLDHPRRRPFTHHGSGGQDGSGDGGGTSAPQAPSSPIRAALNDNFPDPDIWYHEGTYYAFATNNAAGILQRPHNGSSYEYGTSNIQIAKSTDFVNWDLLNSSSDPLPTVGKWVTPGMTKLPPQIPKANVWAPAVIQRPTDNKFVMYYSANRDNATEPVGRHPPPHCVGAAISRGDSPVGPYDPVTDALACPIDQGGAIDPAAFKDTDGTLYMAYKVDGNNIGHGGMCGNTKQPIVPTPIMLQKMQPDGLTGDGDPIQILDRIKVDGPLVEAPAITRSPEGIYFLFFSSGCTRSPTYDVKYATSKQVSGPYVRSGKPLLQTGDYGLLAPGSVGIHDDGQGGYNMAFHARVNMPQGRIRAMFTTKLEFDGHVVRIVSENGTAT